MITAAPGTLHVADIQTFADQSQSGHCAVLTRLQGARTDHASCSAYSPRYTEASSLSAGHKTSATKKKQKNTNTSVSQHKEPRLQLLVFHQRVIATAAVLSLQPAQQCSAQRVCITCWCKIRTHDPARTEGNPACIQFFLTSSVTLPYAGTRTGTRPVVVIFKYKMQFCCLLDVFFGWHRRLTKQCVLSQSRKFEVCVKKKKTWFHFFI